MKDKLQAILRIIKSPNYAVITVNHKQVNVITKVRADLTSAMLLAVTIQKTFDALTKEIQKQAIDQGEAHTLIALQKVIDAVEKDVIKDVRK